MSLAASAKPVSPSFAADVAGVFFPGADMKVQEIGDIYLFTPVDGGGYVLVAADDCVRPVLAWSPSGTFDIHGMPQHVRNWIDGYQREIEAMKQATPSASVAAEWDMYLGGRAKTGIVVAPMVTTIWNQGNPFNVLCPYDEQDSARSVTGCTATATAQVMKYWNHPEVGWGSHSYYHANYGVLSAQFDTTHYRWTLMPDTLRYFSSSEQINAVAELMYHVGVAVNMNYSPRSSGAAVNSYGYTDYPSAENALKTYFRYNPLLHSVFKSEYTDAEWDSLLRVEIDAARPVLYAGYDSAGGHAFVLDGYDSNGMFHVNWGWGGAYDGYYTTDSLSPGAGGIGGNATYTFNMNNSAVIGIMPPVAASDSVSVISMVSGQPTLGTVTGSGTYANYSPVNITATANAGCRFVRWASGNTSNPMGFLANGDICDTAMFEYIAGDTLGYCYDALRNSWHDDYGDTTAWAIRLPASMRYKGRTITAVQIYVYEPYTEYTISLFSGDSINGNTPFHTQQFSPQPWRGWQTVELDSPMVVDNNTPLWIAATCIGGGYPASNSRYSGNTDGSWYRLPEGWRRFDQQGEFMTWMLRAVFEPHPVTVEVRPADEDHSTVFGGGQYMGGDTVTVGAIILDPRCSFRGWSGTNHYIINSDNPYTFVAEEDVVLIAHCDCGESGISDVDGMSPSIVVEGMTVYSDIPAVFYDVQGRVMHVGTSFAAPAPGVYVARFGASARKIIIMNNQ